MLWLDGQAPGVPGWVGVLLAAETWHIAPWELAGDGDRLLWWWRWRKLSEARADYGSRRHR